MTRYHKKYTKKEKRVIRENLDKGEQWLAKELNRTPAGIISMAQRMGLEFKKPRTKRMPPPSPIVTPPYNPSYHMPSRVGLVRTIWSYIW